MLASNIANDLRAAGAEIEGGTTLFLNWEIEVSVRAIRESTKHFCDKFVWHYNEGF